MTKETKQALKNFVSKGTLFSGHHLDQQRFYKFIVEAYKNESEIIEFEDFKLTAEEVREKAFNEHQIENYLRKWYSTYTTGLDIIRVYDTGLILAE